MKSRLLKIRRRSRPGDPPGTLIAPAEAKQPAIDIFTFNDAGFTEKNGVGVESVREMYRDGAITWVNLTGLGDASTLEQLGELFGVHRLALEDVLNLHQRPKVEAYQDHLFIVARMIATGSKSETEQLSIFLGNGYVFSVQEKPGDCFDPVRKRIREGRGIVRSSGADYLAYTLIDAVVDAYFPALEALGEDLEELEDLVLRNSASSSMAALHEMKRELLNVRRAIWPHREMLNGLLRDEYLLVSRATQVYLRDSYDHTIQLMDIVETYREVASDLVDVHISSVSARLNEIMKVLTIIATIFMPLGFIASVYGMNFDRSVSGWNMPELGWRLGYVFSLGLMAVCAVGLLAYFWRKGWLRDDERDRRR